MSNMLSSSNSSHPHHQHPHQHPHPSSSNTNSYYNDLHAISQTLLTALDNVLLDARILSLSSLQQDYIHGRRRTSVDENGSSVVEAAATTPSSASSTHSISSLFQQHLYATTPYSPPSKRGRSPERAGAGVGVGVGVDTDLSSSSSSSAPPHHHHHHHHQWKAQRTSEVLSAHFAASCNFEDASSTCSSVAATVGSTAATAFQSDGMETNSDTATTTTAEPMSLSILASQRAIRPLRSKTAAHFRRHDSTMQAGRSPTLVVTVQQQPQPPPPLSIDAEHLYAILMDMDQTVNGASMGLGHASDLLGQIHVYQRLLDEKNTQWTSELLKQHVLPPSVLLQSPLEPTSMDTTMSLPSHEELQRLFTVTADKTRAWFLDILFCLLDRCASEVDVQFALHQNQSFNGAFMKSFRRHNSGGGGNSGGNGRGNGGTGGGETRLLVESTLLCVTEFMELGGFPYHPECMDGVFARLLDQYLSLFTLYLLLSIPYFDGVVSGQSKSRVMAHFEKMERLMCGLKTILGPPSTRRAHIWRSATTTATTATSSNTGTTGTTATTTTATSMSALLLSPSLFETFSQAMIESGLRLLEHTAKECTLVRQRSTGGGGAFGGSPTMSTFSFTGGGSGGASGGANDSTSNMMTVTTNMTTTSTTTMMTMMNSMMGRAGASSPVLPGSLLWVNFAARFVGSVVELVVGYFARHWEPLASGGSGASGGSSSGATSATATPTTINTTLEPPAKPLDWQVFVHEESRMQVWTVERGEGGGRVWCSAVNSR